MGEGEGEMESFKENVLKGFFLKKIEEWREVSNRWLWGVYFKGRDLLCHFYFLRLFVYVSKLYVKRSFFFLILEAR